MAISHFKFYDKKGNNITPLYEDGVYYFNLYFDKVSTGLFETEHIFIFEEILKHYKLNEISNDHIIREVNESILIKVLTRLYEKNKPLTKDDIFDLFVFESITYNSVDEFVSHNNNYIIRDLRNNTIFYTISEAGRNYLDNYNNLKENYVFSNLGLIPQLVRPRANFKPEFEEDTYLYFKWKNNSDLDKNLFVFMVDNEDETKYFNKNKSSCTTEPKTFPTLIPLYNDYLNIDDTENVNWKKMFIPYRFDKGNDDTFLYSDTFERRILAQDSELNRNPLQLNFAITSDVEGFFNRTLEVYLVRKGNKLNQKEWLGGTEAYHYSEYLLETDVYLLAEITLYGEVEGEDERFKTILENFGKKIDVNDYYVFRETDVEEDLPDYIKINEKRKELLLAGDEIFPYMGSYKAFVNAIKWLGYSDLRIKEYFYNVRLSNPEDKVIYYSSIEIPLDLKRNFKYNPNKSYNEQLYGNILNNPDYKKTSRFGLYYDINKLTGEYDEYGIPIVEDSFIFTPEEVLIKLFGLKNVLQKYFLPHHARIIDITGEGIYFGKFFINTWNTINPIFTLLFGRNPDFVGYPLVGYLKPLDRLLNLYKSFYNIFEYDILLDPNETILNIADNCLTEYLGAGRTDFPFQSKLPLERFTTLYSSYTQLKTDVLYHLKNTYCPDKPIPSKSFQRMLGQPVELDLIHPIVIWNDLSVKWIDTDAEPPTGIIRAPKQADIKIDEYRISEELTGPYVQSPIFTWDRIGFFDGFEMEWIIKHVKNLYCFSRSGKIEDLEKIIVFLPQVGKYDVTCVVKDITGFPNITRKREYLEVLKPHSNIVAFGRFIDTKKYWDETDNKYYLYESSWDLQGNCPLKTLWNDAIINWDSLNYELYLKQDYVRNDINTTTILNVDTSKNSITLHGKGFYDDYVLNKDIKYRRNIVISRDSDFVPEQFNVPIESFYRGQMTLSGNYTFTSGEKINIYRYDKTSNFILNNNELRIFSNYYEDFEIGKTITLIQQNSILGNRNEEYTIIDIKENIEKGYVDLILEDDGSLAFWPTNNKPTTIKYNYSLWNFVEFKSDNYTLTVQGFTYNEFENKTKVKFKEIDSISMFKNVDMSDYRMEHGILAGWYVFDVDDTTVKLDTNNNTQILIYNSDICKIDTNFYASWAKYDFDWALQYSNTKDISFNTCHTMTYDDIKHQTWYMFDYHGDSMMGFRMWNIENIEFNTYFSIFFNNIEERYYLNSISNLTVDAEIDSAVSQYKYSEVTRLLNESKQLYTSKYIFYNINNKYIVAVNKNSNTNSLYQLSYSGGIIGYKDTYPRAFYSDYSEVFFKGDNNPPLWNYLKSGLEENSNQYLNPTNNTDNTLPYLWYINGAFSWIDTFIAKKDFTVPKFTQVFFTFDDMYYITLDTTYEWELWEEKTKKLLTKSYYPYLTWNFIDSGVYSIKIQIKDKNIGDEYIEKKSWITVQ